MGGGAACWAGRFGNSNGRGLSGVGEGGGDGDDDGDGLTTRPD
jgi:hypothetical protein